MLPNYKMFERLVKDGMRVLLECVSVKNGGFLFLQLWRMGMAAELLKHLEGKSIITLRTIDQDLLTCSSIHLRCRFNALLSDLIYEIELVHAEQGPRHPEVFDLMDTDKNGFLSRNEIFQFVHDELEKQGEMNKITTDEENEMISQILEMEGMRF